MGGWHSQMWHGLSMLEAMEGLRAVANAAKSQYSTVTNDQAKWVDICGGWQETAWIRALPYLLQNSAGVH